jgi:hypothetical protein
MALSSAKRRHVMEALTVYSKYLGRYDRWCEIRKRYSLHWTNIKEKRKEERLFYWLSYMLCSAAATATADGEVVTIMARSEGLLQMSGLVRVMKENTA